MLLHEVIRADLTLATKTKAKTVSDLRYILGEFSRLKGDKDGKVYIGDTLTDEQAIRVLVSIIAGESTLLELVPNTTSTLKPLAESYLPIKATREELLIFITTIDFSQLKNKLQAIGIVKKHFGVKADSQMIAEIIQGI
ncbi:hypothetical protein JZU46_02845 [bacterium]|nr:hypothetical protein [bacterium]